MSVDYAIISKAQSELLTPSGPLTTTAIGVAPMANNKRITQALVRQLFDYQDGKLIRKISSGSRWPVGSQAGHISKHIGYRVISMGQIKEYEHRVVFLWHHGYMPKEIDHINLDRADNRIENLRDVISSVNKWNSKARGTSYYQRHGYWTAQIAKFGKKTHLGCFKTEEDAHQAYLAAKPRFHQC